VYLGQLDTCRHAGVWYQVCCWFWQKWQFLSVCHDFALIGCVPQLPFLLHMVIGLVLSPQAICALLAWLSISPGPAGLRYVFGFSHFGGVRLICSMKCSASDFWHQRRISHYGHGNFVYTPTYISKAMFDFIGVWLFDPSACTQKICLSSDWCKLWLQCILNS